MPQFAIYHYELSAYTNKEPLLFPINDNSRQYKTLENLFESYLPGRGGSLNVLEPKVSGSGENKKTEYEPHESEVLQNQNHIIAFKVQRNGTKKIETIDWQQKDELQMVFRMAVPTNKLVPQRLLSQERLCTSLTMATTIND